MARTFTSRDETVTIGNAHAGTIEGRQDGFRAFGPEGQHVGTFPAIAEARRALFQLHQSSQAALLASA